MKRLKRYCYRCVGQVEVPPGIMVHFCGSTVFWSGRDPRSQTGTYLYDTLPEEQPPVDVTYGTPVRKRGRWGHGPV